MRPSRRLCRSEHGLRLSFSFFFVCVLTRSLHLYFGSIDSPCVLLCAPFCYTRRAVLPTRIHVLRFEFLSLRTTNSEHSNAHDHRLYVCPIERVGRVSLLATHWCSSLLLFSRDARVRFSMTQQEHWGSTDRPLSSISSHRSCPPRTRMRRTYSRSSNVRDEPRRFHRLVGWFFNLPVRAK